LSALVKEDQDLSCQEPWAKYTVEKLSAAE